MRFRITMPHYIAERWFSHLSSLFVALIIWHILAIFEGFWWEETYRIVHTLIVTIVMIDVLLPVWRSVRLLLQGLAAVIITISHMKFSQAAFAGGTRERLDWVQGMLVQLHPFIWIAFMIVGIYILFSGWATTRRRIVGIVSAGLLSLTIADSFTPVWLWDEVAWVVFAGLAWLVADHFHRFQREHPGSWKELLDYPVALFLPIAVVISLLMTAGLAVPSIAPVLKDPYTIWRESKGHSVTVNTGPKAPTSITPQNNADNRSGYGRNDENLGGGFQFDYSPVMTVDTNRRSYWRGESKSFYTGDGWTRGLADERSSTSRVTKDVMLKEAYERPAAKMVQVKQTFNMIRQDPYSVLFAASPVSQVHWVNDSESAIPRSLLWEPKSMELRWPRKSPQKYPVSYSVTSTLPVLDEAALRGTRAGWKDESLNKSYLQLPETLPERVVELAKEVTIEAANDYDRAKKIEEYLRVNYSYTNEPDNGLRESLDFTDAFLFEIRSGYCDYFSTAMAVMSRSIGLPARWVKGFAPGALPVEGFPGGPGGGPGGLAERNPDGAGTYTVRNADAHSWVEIYFEGFGWIPFEPTSGFSFPYTVAEDEVEPLPEPSTAPSEVKVKAEPEMASYTAISMWVALSAFLVLGTAWLIIRRQALVNAWRSYRLRAYTPDERIVWETDKLLRHCRKHGLQHEDHETLREAVERWSLDRERLRGEFSELLHAFEGAKYSSRSATDEDAERYSLKVKSLQQQLKGYH
ncbi:DUF3488 and DUF4129 domain-containing transglutaminase family protein [Paenibacillus sp. GCM10023252]|uniref:transglutaminase TgpA family protein n=1 Tax=Paenibacillus sp. GCM10023252 TaxID=3252649 RepID=UPI003605C08B